jgi:hypothetical protein
MKPIAFFPIGPIHTPSKDMIGIPIQTTGAKGAMGTTKTVQLSSIDWEKPRRLLSNPKVTLKRNIAPNIISQTVSIFGYTSLFPE